MPIDVDYNSECPLYRTGTIKKACQQTVCPKNYNHCRMFQSTERVPEESDIVQILKSSNPREVEI
jgi:hypothetical protein